MAKKNNSELIKQLERKVEHLELLNGMNSFSVPRGALTTNSNILTTALDRDSIYAERQEMYNDAFVREMVKVSITRAIGTAHDNIKPLTLQVKEDAKISNIFRKTIQQDLQHLEDIIDDVLLDIAMDSQFFGDGYGRKVFKENIGITKILRNITVKPFNITPIVSNHGREIAYEVGNLFDRVKQNNIAFTKNGRFYVNPNVIARMNAKGNGTARLTSEQYTTLNNLNLFNDEETVYEDSIYGGILEDTYDDYLNYKWALQSLTNSRIGASVIERFITLSLNSTSDEERKELKQALETQITTTLSSLKNRVNNKNPDLLIANYIVPTTEDGTNNIGIQESNINAQAFQTVDDIMIHIRKFLGAIGINIEMTSFAGMTMGGRERDSAYQQSLEADAQGTQIRKAIRGFAFDIIKTHFLAKYGTEIDINIIDVRFQSVINQAKVTAEQQRLDSITNTQQVFGIIEQLKQIGLEKNDDNIIMVRSVLDDIISSASNNRKIVLDSLTNIVFTKNSEEII